MHTQLVPIRSLVIHPTRQLLARPAESDVQRMAADICNNGMHYPLITHNGRIIDGEVRWLGAIQAGECEVMVIEKTADEAASFIFSTYLIRQHSTHSALAYYLYPLLEDVLAEANRRRLANLQIGSKKSSTSLPVGKNAEEFAVQYGISRSLLFMAKALHEKFAARPKLRAKYEPQIMSGEMSLGAVQQATGGKIAASEGKTTPKNDPAQLMLELWDIARTRLGRWPSMTPEQKAKDLEKFRSQVLPQLSAEHHAEWKRFLKERE